MKHHYRDIRDKIATEPLWWDEVGVPRYCVFSPKETNDIYADEVAFLEIACQNCRRRFKVALRAGSRQRREGAPSLDSRVRDGSLHYGDPPNIGCCPAGPTMNSVPLRVLEFWVNDGGKWRRQVEFEVEVEVEMEEDGGLADIETL